MYRMEYTERIRTKIREEKRREVREKADKEESKEKMQIERIKRNRKWRERKVGKEKLKDVLEDQILDEKEQRKIKNIEWRERRKKNQDADTEKRENEMVGLNQNLKSMILNELLCPFCHEEMSPPTRVFQCKDGHNLCEKCKIRDDIKVHGLYLNKFSF